MNPVRILASVTPVLFAFLLVALANLSGSALGPGLPAPLLGLAPVYFWTLVRPDLMPPVAVLGIGLWEDLLSGGPPGLWGAGFLAAYWLADRQREVFSGLSGWTVLTGFASAILMAAATAYLLGSVVYWRLPTASPLLLQCLVTVILYPVLAVLMGWMHRVLAGALRGDD